MLHQIGVGALGPVFRTYEPTRDRLVAVKVFRLDITPEQARSLADELGRAAESGLFHPSIVEPVASGIEGTVAYRAEEYVAAESLDVAMRHYAPATLDKVLPFIGQLAAAIDFARAAGVGHGALHPRDIFVTPDEARATGFGVVDALDRLGLRAPVRRPYSAPERIDGKPWSTTADVFALAAIAFELMTGRRPSGLGAEMGALTGAVLGDRHDAVRDVLARAMHEKPIERYATAGAFVTALADAAGSARADAPGVDPELTLRAPAGPVPAAIDVVIRDATPAEDLSADVPIASAVEPETAAVPTSGLDDFTVESPAMAAPGDSPREVARRVIAARKRQARPKPQTESELPLPVEIPLPATIPIPIETASPIEEASAAATPVAAEPDAGADDAAPAPVAPLAATLDPEPLSPDPVRPDPLVDKPVLLPALEVVPAFEPPVDTDQTIVASQPQSDHDEAAPVLRDVSDRVVAVDEFRARDSGSNPMLMWPRTPERAVSEKVTLPTPSPIQSVDPDLPLLPAEVAATERARVAMLPNAIMLILGLLLGYAGGYVVGSREQRASDAAKTTALVPPAALQTPGTSGQAAGKEFSEQSVAPAARPPAANPPVVRPEAAATAATPSPATAAPSRTRAPRRGRLVVTSTPSRAAVTVNGTWRGRTPLTLDELAFGKYVVRVVEPGYEVAREEFSLSAANANRTITAKLRASSGRQSPQSSGAAAPAAPPKPQTTGVGEIYVDSRPRGARVLIDGREHGVTPLRVPGQSVGAHSIRLELADHAPWTHTAQVVAGQIARVTGSLERIRQDR